VPLVPALAIDAALADREFAAWVKAAPESTGINPDVSLIDGIWHVGLFRFGANQLERYGGVTLAPGWLDHGPPVRAVAHDRRRTFGGWTARSGSRYDPGTIQPA
jgi:hypothetical protein